MFEKEKKPSLFPPEYEHLEAAVLSAHEKIKTIDEQINNLPPDKGLAPNYNPPGAFTIRHPLTKQERTDILQERKEKIQEKTKTTVAKGVSKADKTLAKSMIETTDRLIYPVASTEIADRELASAKEKGRSPDQSQDYMRSLLFEHHDRQQPSPEPVQSLDATDRFTQMIDDFKNTPGESGISQEQDDIDMDKD